jgi:hypothetical protein
MRHGNARCEAPWCRQWIALGASAVRLHGRLWHASCAVRYRRQRQEARKPVAA